MSGADGSDVRVRPEVTNDEMDALFATHAVAVAEAHKLDWVHVGLRSSPARILPPVRVPTYHGGAAQAVR